MKKYRRKYNKTVLNRLAPQIWANLTWRIHFCLFKIFVAIIFMIILFLVYTHFNYFMFFALLFFSLSCLQLVTRLYQITFTHKTA